MPPERIEPGPGQESMWDYPRPPAAEPVEKGVRVVFAGEPVAWCYPSPVEQYAALTGHFAFYLSKVRGRLRGRRESPSTGRRLLRRLDHLQVAGPFKGPPGTLGW